MELNFTPKAIYKIESESGQPITSLIQRFSMTSLLLLVKHGQNVDEDVALDAIEQYLEEKPENDMISLFVDILEGLQKKGFLPRSLQLGEMRDSMNQALKEANSDDSSTNSGKKAS